MGYPIPADEAKALRERVHELKAKHPERIAPITRVVGPSSFYAFMSGARSIAPPTARRLEAMLKETPMNGAIVKPADESRPRGPGEKGRVYQYISEPEAVRLRELVHAHVKANLGGRYIRFAETAGVTWGAMAKPLKGKTRITLQLADRLRAGLTGKPKPAPAPAKRGRGRPRTVNGDGRALVLAAHDRAPRNVLAKLRLDTGHVLSNNFGGSVAGLAKEIGITTFRLRKFLDGGPLTLDESAHVANRLSAIAPPVETVSPSPGVTMVRAIAGGMSVEAWRNGGPVGANGMGEGEPAEIRARKMLERWKGEALELVIQIAGGIV